VGEEFSEITNPSVAVRWHLRRQEIILLGFPGQDFARGISL